MTTPKIALIGLEASGKTVLTTVLAKTLSQTRDQGYFFIPQDFSTYTYVESVWRTLQKWDWPPSTAPGEMFKLKWKMCITPEFSGNGQSYEADFHLIDAAGQDMRQLFSYDDEEDVPPHLRPLADYCMESDILLIALNIKDYVGESDSMRVIENEAIIKVALDRLNKPNQRVALIFTQMDQYNSYIDQFGGFEKFCKEKLTYIYNVYIANTNRVTILGIAAVNNTEIVEKEDGILLRVPKPCFSSMGLGILGKWIANQIVDVAKAEAVSTQPLPQPTIIPPVPQQPLFESNSNTSSNNSNLAEEHQQKKDDEYVTLKDNLQAILSVVFLMFILGTIINIIHYYFPNIDQSNFLIRTLVGFLYLPLFLYPFYLTNLIIILVIYLFNFNRKIITYDYFDIAGTIGWVGVIIIIGLGYVDPELPILTAIIIADIIQIIIFLIFVIKK